MIQVHDTHSYIQTLCSEVHCGFVSGFKVLLGFRNRRKSHVLAQTSNMHIKTEVMFRLLWSSFFDWSIAIGIYTVYDRQLSRV